MAFLFENKVIVDDSKQRDRLLQKGFGERKQKDLVLDLFEAVYLLEKEKIEVFEKNKKVSKKKLLDLGLKKDKLFYSKYTVFNDLRERGFVI